HTPVRGRRVRILVENGDYGLCNIGDIAQLQVAVRRLSTLWPDAVIEVVTSDPAALALHCPPACAVQPAFFVGREIWLAYRVAAMPASYQEALRTRHPRLTGGWMRWRMRLGQLDTSAIDTFLGTVARAD